MLCLLQTAVCRLILLRKESHLTGIDAVRLNHIANPDTVRMSWIFLAKRVRGVITVELAHLMAARLTIYQDRGFCVAPYKPVHLLGRRPIRRGFRLICPGGLRAGGAGLRPLSGSDFSSIYYISIVVNIPGCEASLYINVCRTGLRYGAGHHGATNPLRSRIGHHIVLAGRAGDGDFVQQGGGTVCRNLD